MAYQRYFAHITYQGTHYHGWQIQPNAISVQETIETEMSKILREKISIIGCGRTDTGVHARAYYFHFDSPEILDIDQCIFKLNGMLPSDISFHEIIPVGPKAHARFDASYRAYTYHIHFTKNPFLTDFSWYYPWYNLDFKLMKQAAEILKNYTDFPMFCKAGSDVKTFICHIYDISLDYDEQEKKLEFNIGADRFLRTMIRRIVGTLIQIGRGKMSIEEFENILIEKKELPHINLAPPQGLYLSAVKYESIEALNK